MIELMPHQVEAAKKLGNGKILWGGVGSGKSYTVLEYYMKNEAPRNIHVITTAKKRDHLDWEKDAVQFGISTKRELTRPGTGYINVDSYNNISKYEDTEDAFFIFDEQRLVGGGSWVKSFQKIAKKNHWVLLTATPGDTWMDYIPMFVANNLYKNSTEFKREHVVYAPWSKYPKVMRYTDVATLEKYRNMILVEMPYLKHTKRILETIEVAYDEELFDKAVNKRWHVFEDRPIKDVSELFAVMRKIVATHPSRIQAIRDLIQDHPKVIIFYNFNYELDILRGLCDTTNVAEWNGHKKQPIPDADKWVYLVQYVAGAEGWNCIATDTVVFYSLTYSWKNFEQAQGRIDRLNTSFIDLFYFILLSNSLIDKAVRKSLDKKETFNENAYAKKMMNLVGNW